MSGKIIGAAADARGEPDLENMRLIGHNNLGSRGDCMHVNVVDGLAYVGHMGESRIGTSILDVHDPSQPQLVTQLPVPDHTHSHKVQVVDDVLLVNYEQFGSGGRGQTGLKVFDVSTPSRPREIGFLPMAGKGVHRMTYWQSPYAYVTGSDAGWTDQFFMTVDLSDPSLPRETGRWWLPGMWTAGGEQSSAPPGRRFALHHALVRGDRASMGWWDAGLVILDIGDKEHPNLVSRLDFGAAESGCTHTALPVPGRDLLAVTDEAVHDNCAEVPKLIRLIDVADEQHPREITRLPMPEGDFCTRGGRFGAHNLHEPRPGSLVDGNTLYATYFSAGIRIYDIADQLAPKEIAHFVPEAPPGRPCIQMNDITVTADGLIYATDRYVGGLYIFEFDDPRKC